jgi:hypothetical protein
MLEGTTSRVMAADRLYGEFYDFYSVSPEYFGFTLVVSMCLNISRHEDMIDVGKAPHVIPRQSSTPH